MASTRPAPPRLNDVVESDIVELSPAMLAELLDVRAWGEILGTYGRTMGVASALTDAQGRMLGDCHNPQLIWQVIHDAPRAWDSACPFCIASEPPCDAVAEAIRTGAVVVVHDRVGFTHLAAPLFLGAQPLGAIVAGQVFDRYPEPLSMRRTARAFGLAPQPLWELARKQRPVSAAALKSSGDLLKALGRAFVLQRYGAIVEAQLAETNSRFRLLVEAVTDYALFTMDSNGLVNSWNGGAERLLGYTDDQIIGQNFSCFFTADDIRGALPVEQLGRALKEGQAHDEGWRVRMNHGQFLAQVTITPMLGETPRGEGFAIIMQDVTELREAALTIAKAQQERQRIHETFLSHVSHELRTPMTAIYFFTSNVLDGLFGEVTPEQHEHLAFALDSVGQLKTMVSDLLDLTSLDTNKLTVELECTSVVQVVDEVLRTCQESATARHIRLHSAIDPALPFAWADPSRLRQILTNLVENGIKFTPDGGTVTVANQPVTESRLLCFSVSDTGGGISSEHQEKIFDRLAQVSNGVETSRTGLGLGLFIARELVSRHGGRLWVESELGHGSTFYFTIPVFMISNLCAGLAPFEGAPGAVTVLAIDVVPARTAVRANLLPEIRTILQGCIHAHQDVLLPGQGGSDTVKSFFIIACADAGGSEVIAKRIRQELQKVAGALALEPFVSLTTLPGVSANSSQERSADVMARVAQLVQVHRVAKKGLA